MVITKYAETLVDNYTPPPGMQATPVLYRSYLGDCLEQLDALPDGCVDLIYTDPPFNTGTFQSDINGFFDDSFPDGNYVPWLSERLAKAWSKLSSQGTMYVHLDYHECHYIKVELDRICGRQNFLNEIIWAYDFGGRSKKKWPAKHDNILMYGKPDYIFNYDEMDREPYMAPGLVGPEKAARGKTPTDVWWHTIVPTNSKERLHYPTQKPLFLAERIIKISSNYLSTVLDPFSGSGTTSFAALKHGRHAVDIDNSHLALWVAAHHRLGLRV